MKLSYKTETELLKEVEFTRITEEIIDEFKGLFDDEHIQKLEINFNDGFLVKECSDTSNIPTKAILSVIITIKK